MDVVKTDPTELSDSKSTPPLVLPVIEKKNDQNSTVGENILLSKVPQGFLSKAKLLLEAFDKNPQRLTWNDVGELTINNESVPNANIYHLMPAVYKPLLSNKKNLPGFNEFVNQIGAMGLANLISPKLMRGFRRKSSIKNANEIFSEIIKNDRWYYLGPI